MLLYSFILICISFIRPCPSFFVHYIYGIVVGCIWRIVNPPLIIFCTLWDSSNPLSGIFPYPNSYYIIPLHVRSGMKRRKIWIKLLMWSVSIFLVIPFAVTVCRSIQFFYQLKKLWVQRPRLEKNGGKLVT